VSPLETTYWVIPGYAIFFALLALAAGLFSLRTYRLIRYMSLGQQETSLLQLGLKAARAVAAALRQWRQLRPPREGIIIAHAFLGWGFIILVGLFFLFILIDAKTGTATASGFFYYAWATDIVASILIVAASFGIIRRYILRPPRLQGERNAEITAILATVLALPLAHLATMAAIISLGQLPAAAGAALPPVSAALSDIFGGMSTSSVELAGTALFWAYWSLFLFVLVLIPYSIHFHMIASPFNIVLRSSYRGLRSIDLETADTFGAASITDLAPKQVLDLYSCAVCGQCQEACPATRSGKPLNPKKIIQDLRRHLLKVGASAKNDTGMLAGKVLTEDEIWACTTCRACDEICPTYVEHIDKVVDLRRNLVLERAAIPESAEAALRSIEARGHPWRGATASRTDWAQGLNIKTLAEDSDIDILFWVGCTGALEERSMKVSRALARILGGVNFGILGTEESCCGEPARRLGNEYLFQMQAEKNIRIMNGYNVKRVVTTCPHCYHTLKNEYPGFGGEFEVIHHTEFIARQLKEGKLKSGPADGGSVTYHDACYLGRYNDVYQPPRQILNRLNMKPVEMKDNRQGSFCCGGGGGRLWLEENIGRRISEMRIEQASQAGAQTIATACPYCLQMFDDAIKALKAPLKVADVAELVAGVCLPPPD
jgi:Fe-S oxidoreductase